MTSEWHHLAGAWERSDGAKIGKGVWHKGWHGESPKGWLVIRPTKYVHQEPKPKSFRSAKLAMQAVDEEFPMKKKRGAK